MIEKRRAKLSVFESVTLKQTSITKWTRKNLPVCMSVRRPNAGLLQADCFGYTVQFVDMKDMFTSVSFVSRPWRKLVNQHKVEVFQWRHMCSDRITCMKGFLSVIQKRQFSNINKLDLWGTKRLDVGKSVFKKLERHCPNLREINFGNARLGRCRRRSATRASRSSGGSDVIEPSNRTFEQPGDSVIGALASSSIASQLHTLQLSNKVFSSKAIIHIAHSIPSIEVLELGDIQLMDPPKSADLTLAFQSLGQMKRLRHLNLSDLYYIHSPMEDFNGHIMAMAEESPRQLEKLVLNGQWELSGAGVNAIIKGCRTLEVLSLLDMNENSSRSWWGSHDQQCFFRRLERPSTLKIISCGPRPSLFNFFTRK